MTYNETVEKLLKLWSQIWLRDSTLQLNSWGCVQTLFDILPVNNRKTLRCLKFKKQNHQGSNAVLLSLPFDRVLQDMVR